MNKYWGIFIPSRGREKLFSSSVFGHQKYQTRHFKDCIVQAKSLPMVQCVVSLEDAT